MLKKIVSLLAVVSIMAGLLSACGKTSNVSASVRLAELIVKAKTLINQPGWVHVTEKITYDTDQENRGIMPNGMPIPLVQTVDTWYHINERKLVYEYVATMINQDDQPVQVMVFLDNRVTNLTTSVTAPLNPYSLAALDHQFFNDAKDYTSRLNKQPTLKTDDLNGRVVAIFTLKEKLDSPQTIEEYEQPITSIQTVAYFDQESGLLYRLERFVILKDRSERAFFTNDITVEINVQPPQDILNYTHRIW